MQMNRILFFSVICLAWLAFCYLGGNTTLLANTSSQKARRASSDEVNWYPTQWESLIGQRLDVVPNEKTAASIAEAILIPIYGDKQIQSEKPSKVSLEDNIWLIEGALPEVPPTGREFRIENIQGEWQGLVHHSFSMKLT